MATDIRAKRAERKREEILRAGLKVFAQKGFNAATMDDIALELEATKGLLYYHFKTKEDLLAEILARNELTDGFETVLDGLAEMPLRDALTTFGERLAALFDANRELARFLHVHSLLSGAEAAIIYTEVLAKLYGRVAELLESFRRRALMREEVDTVHLARVVSSLLIADLAQRFIFGHGQESGPGYLPQDLDLLLHGIAPREPSPKTK